MRGSRDRPFAVVGIMLGVLVATVLLATLALTALPSAAQAEGRPTVHDVTSELMCQCGCALTVAACRESMTCSVADDFIDTIQRKIEAGDSKSEILNSFAEIYGDGVLASPRKSGFALTAWVAPFAAIGVAAAGISGLVWGWSRRRPATQEAAARSAASETMTPYEERVERELGGQE